MGPSKEELSNYFKNNRKYFDELANHFKNTDPEYYKRNIAPFYGNPFISVSGKKNVRPTLAIFSAMFIIFIVGIVMFFFVNQKANIKKVYDEDAIEENVNADEELENIKVKIDPSQILDTLSAVKDLGDYEKGIMYYNLGDYKKAEKYLLKVSANNPMYRDANDKLKEIRKKK